MGEFTITIMERDNFPNFDLFPRLTKIAHAILDHVRYPSRSEHFTQPLDEPYDQFVTYADVDHQLLERRVIDDTEYGLGKRYYDGK